jgi:hypothetical protein
MLKIVYNFVNQTDEPEVHFKHQIDPLGHGNVFPVYQEQSPQDGHPGDFVRRFPVEPTREERGIK